jgi:hypothetical protein
VGLALRPAGGSSSFVGAFISLTPRSGKLDGASARRLVLYADGTRIEAGIHGIQRTGSGFILTTPFTTQFNNLWDGGSLSRVFTFRSGVFNACMQWRDGDRACTGASWLFSKGVRFRKSLSVYPRHLKDAGRLTSRDGLTLCAAVTLRASWRRVDWWPGLLERISVRLARTFQGTWRDARPSGRRTVVGVCYDRGCVPQDSVIVTPSTGQGSSEPAVRPPSLAAGSRAARALDCPLLKLVKGCRAELDIGTVL